MVTLDFTTLVRNQVAAIQAMANNVLDFAIGSIMRAVVESNSTLVVYLSNLILELLATTRASTSTGTDLDSWVGDYGLVRIPAVAASGYVTFARFTPSQIASVPVGTLVETGDGSISFTVIADVSNSNFDGFSNSYILNINIPSIDIPVIANIAGVVGNVAIGGINTLTQTVVGVDTVTNAAGFINGVDAESDAALRSRFVAFIASLAKATRGSIAFAITSVQPNLSYTIVENQDYNGVDRKGYFFVVVDDSTGDPPSTLLDSVYTAVDMVRPLCSSFGVFSPIVIVANVVLTVTVDTGYDSAAVKLNVQSVISNYINSLGLGVKLPYTMLVKLAYDADPGVINVSAVTVNGGVSDILATALQTIKTGTVTVN
jgi:hypothetical protein